MKLVFGIPQWQITHLQKEKEKKKVKFESI